MNSRYLIVDDEPDMCWVFERLLTARGESYQKAHTAQAAIALMQSHQFQIAILDIILPDMNGMDLARILHQLDPLLRFVIVSGCPPTESVMSLTHSEGLICTYMKKPFSHNEIIRIIEDFQGTVPDYLINRE